MAATAQTYSTHRKFVPLFHYVLLPFLLLNIIAMGYHLYQEPDLSHGWSLAMSFALILIALFGRGFALKAQDRVIRLEERLRMRELLPPDLKARIHEFTPAQLIALRFASDAELPAIAAKVLAENLQDRDTIKKAVKTWRADDLRV